MYHTKKLLQWLFINMVVSRLKSGHYYSSRVRVSFCGLLLEKNWMILGLNSKLETKSITKPKKEMTHRNGIFHLQ